MPENGIYTRSAGSADGWDKCAPDHYAFFVDGEQVSIDTVHALRTNLADARDRNRTLVHQHVEFQMLVHRAFSDLVSNDELDRSTANEVLDDLGLDRLAVEYTVEVVIAVTLLVESILDADDVKLALEDSTPEIDWGHGNPDLGVEEVDRVHVTVQEVSEE